MPPSKTHGGKSWLRYVLPASYGYMSQVARDPTGPRRCDGLEGVAGPPDVATAGRLEVRHLDRDAERLADPQRLLDGREQLVQFVADVRGVERAARR